MQVIEEEEPTEEEKIPFTIAGNGEVEDNITDDSSKEFFTVKTKGGNTFFLVIDRARNNENVYMLSMIDEYDLQEFLTDEERNGKEEEKPAVVLPETKPEPEPEVEIEEPEQDDGKLTKILAIVFVPVLAVQAHSSISTFISRSRVSRKYRKKIWNMKLCRQRMRMRKQGKTQKPKNNRKTV